MTAIVLLYTVDLLFLRGLQKYEVELAPCAQGRYGKTSITRVAFREVVWQLATDSIVTRWHSGLNISANTF